MESGGWTDGWLVRNGDELVKIIQRVIGSMSNYLCSSYHRVACDRLRFWALSLRIRSEGAFRQSRMANPRCRCTELGASSESDLQADEEQTHTHKHQIQASQLWPCEPCESAGDELEIGRRACQSLG